MSSIIKLLKIYCPDPSNPLIPLWYINVTSSDTDIYFRPGSSPTITIPVAEDIYIPDKGFEDFSITLTSDLTPSTFDIELYNTNPLPDYVLCNLNLYSNLRFQLYYWNKNDNSLPTLFLAGGVGQIEVYPRTIKFSLVDRLNTLIKPRSRRYDTTCGHILGDSICRINVESNSIAVPQNLTVTGGDPAIGYLEVSGLTTNDDNLRLYQAGYIQVTDTDYSLLSPVKWDIANIDFNRIYLWDMMLGIDLSLLTDIRIVPGCFGTIDDCKAWDNVINGNFFIHMLSSEQFFSPTLNSFLTT